MKKIYTVALRMGAAHNDLCELPSRRTIVDLPPPPEVSRWKGQEARRADSRKLSILTKVAADLCAAYGITAHPAEKAKRPRRRKVPAQRQPEALAA